MHDDLLNSPVIQGMYIIQLVYCSMACYVAMFITSSYHKFLYGSGGGESTHHVVTLRPG